MGKGPNQARGEITLRPALCSALALAVILGGCAWCKSKAQDGAPQNLVRAEALIASAEELARWPNLALFDIPASSFRYTSEEVLRTDRYVVRHITFPSPFNSPYPANNVVHAEYYLPAGKGPFPAVIMLHNLKDDFTLSRIICSILASEGIAALMLEMAYYGERKPVDASGQPIGLKDLDRMTAEPLRQTVMDVRRARQMLEAFPEAEKRHIGIAGLSFGAIVASLAAGVDGKFDRCVFILGGGKFADIIWESPAAASIKKRLMEKGETLETLREELKPVEPTEYASRVDSSKALMLNVKDDDWIQREATVALWEALGKPRIVWYSGSHLGAVVHLYAMIRRTAEYIKE